MELPRDLARQVMELPHDLARQALAATGGKSTLKATKWLLDRRAEVAQQFHAPGAARVVDHESAAAAAAGDEIEVGQTKGVIVPVNGSVGMEVGQTKGIIAPLNGSGAEASKSEKKLAKGREEEEEEEEEEEDDELGLPLLPSSSRLRSSPLWGSNLQGGHNKSPFGDGVPSSASDRPAVRVVPYSIDKRMSRSLPSTMEWLGSSASDRPASIGSSSPLERPNENGDGQQQTQHHLTSKSLKTSEGGEIPRLPDPRDGLQQPAKLSKPLRSPEPVEGAPAPWSAPALQDANHKRKRQEEAEASYVNALPTLSSTPPIGMGLKQQLGPSSSSGKGVAPLAERMRPTSINEILGQDHLLGPNCVLRSLLDRESLPCIIFGGPRGTGKTSLARLIARSASCRFVELSSSKKADSEVQGILEEAKLAKKFGQRTLVFIEALNKLAKSQQEAVLPAIEVGYVVLIGATTENPSTDVISSLLLRCRVFNLKKLQPEHMRNVMERAISDKERGVGVSVVGVSGVESVTVEDEALQFLSIAADGDARLALCALEAAVAIAVGKEKNQKRTEVKGVATARPEVDGIISHKITSSSADRERPIVNTCNAKRDSPYNVLEHLKGNFQFSQEEYAKPFKKIVGGREVVTYGISRERVAQKLVSDADKEGGSRSVREGRDGGIVDQKGVGADSAGQGVRNATQADVGTTIVVTVLDAREAFQCPHLVLEKDREENHSDLISAMLKSIRGGDSNAAIYWLARILEGGEGSLKVAHCLVKFASEDVGMADPQALVQAVACLQACQSLGMHECSVHLTQSVVYLSMAPKSAALLQAFQSAQKVVRDGQNEPVPPHLRNASVGFVKELGYLPSSLRSQTFLKWPESQHWSLHSS